MEDFDLRRFLFAYSIKAIDAIRDMLGVLEREDIELDVLKDYLDEVSIDRHTSRARERGSKQKADFKRRRPPLEPRRLPVIGTCPRCEGQLLGGALPSCETRDTGRLFYAECDSCKYYTETRRIRGKIVETEGGK